MRLWLARIAHTLAPTDEASAAAIRKLAPGECVEVTFQRPRSVKWHKLYFGLCRTIGEQQDPPRDEDSIDMELRVLAGHYEMMRLRDPKSGVLYEVRVPKRIAFERLTHDEWAELWPRLEQAIAERFGAEYLPVAA